MNRTPLFYCKHKHMMKSGGPSDKVGSLHGLLPIEFHDFTFRIDFQELSLFGCWYYLRVFRGGMGPYKIRSCDSKGKLFSTPAVCHH